jgi:antitoxin component YwqK of YwqJK toxin-antitoxin module
MKRNYFFINQWMLLVIILFCDKGYAQKNITNTDGYNAYYYPNGQIASEGNMRSGKPDGYWKTYYVTGTIKSEGSRKNHLLDSLWVFYNASGDTVEKINYMYGKRNGYSYTYDYENKGIISKNGNIISRELYINDKKEGKSIYYFPEGNIKEIVNYVEGKKEGISKEFDQDGTAIALLEHHNDILIDRQRINRKDENGLRQGRWMEFYPDDKIKTDGFYKDGKLDGYYREYDVKGSLSLNMKYAEGAIVEDKQPEGNEVEIRNEYFDDGAIRYSGAYRGELKVGIHREYNEQGQVVGSTIYDDFGRVVSRGIVNERGEKIGPWIDYFSSGEKMREGQYVGNSKNGEWKYFTKDGRIVQSGSFRYGLEDGTWKWFYPDGPLWREEEYFNGKEDGQATEYAPDGEVIASGGYLEGEKEGEWYYKVGDHIEKGKYTVGLREGIWKYYDANNIVKFEGNYSQGNPDGKHVLYYDDGKVMEERYYVGGIREKSWKKYDPEGNVTITITYRNNEEYRINGVRIRLPEPGVTLIR